jgi:hypothetical protein
MRWYIVERLTPSHLAGWDAGVHLGGVALDPCFRHAAAEAVKLGGEKEKMSTIVAEDNAPGPGPI